MKIKIDKDDIVKITSNSLTLFRTGIKSKATRETYEKRLKEVLCGYLENYLKGDHNLVEKQIQDRLALGNKRKISSVLDADFEIRANEFVKLAKENPDEITQLLLTVCSKLKERCDKPENDPDYLNPNTIPNIFKPIKKLLKMNGVHFEWSHIDSSYPEAKYNTETRGYTRKEISQILNFTNPLESAVTYIASSSGIRRGGFEFTWDCIIPVYRKEDDLIMGNYNDTNDEDLVCGMISIYKGTNEQYLGFITPEALRGIKNYAVAWRADTFRDPQPKDPFLKKTGSNVLALNPNAMAKRMEKVSKKSKVRSQLTGEERLHEIPIMNGFRRYFNKINKESFSEDSTLASLIKKEMMMSHTGLIKLDKNYFKTQWKELTEEYLKAVPALTISSEERNKAEVRKLRKERITQDQLKEQIKAELREENKEIKEYLKKEQEKINKKK